MTRLRTSSFLARPSSSGGIFPLPLRMASKSAWSDILDSDLGSVQSRRVNCMSLARSVLPSPDDPWQSAQSISYIFFALASDSGPIFLAAGACDESCGGRAGAEADASTSKTTAVKSKKDLNIIVSSVADVGDLATCSCTVFIRQHYRRI